MKRRIKSTRGSTVSHFAVRIYEFVNRNYLDNMRTGLFMSKSIINKKIIIDALKETITYLENED